MEIRGLKIDVKERKRETVIENIDDNLYEQKLEKIKEEQENIRIENLIAQKIREIALERLKEEGILQKGREK